MSARTGNHSLTALAPNEAAGVAGRSFAWLEPPEGFYAAIRSFLAEILK
jgi:hypothetical protein